MSALRPTLGQLGLMPTTPEALLLRTISASRRLSARPSDLPRSGGTGYLVRPGDAPLVVQGRSEGGELAWCSTHTAGIDGLGPAGRKALGAVAWPMSMA
jgi:hypothetical protein